MYVLWFGWEGFSLATFTHSTVLAVTNLCVFFILLVISPVSPPVSPPTLRLINCFLVGVKFHKSDLY